MKKLENIKKKSTFTQSQITHIKKTVTSGKSLVDEAIASKNTTFLSYLQLPAIPNLPAYLPNFTTTKKETKVEQKPVILLSRQKVDERTIKLVNNLKSQVATDPGIDTLQPLEQISEPKVE